MSFDLDFKDTTTNTEYFTNMAQTPDAASVDELTF